MTDITNTGRDAASAADADAAIFYICTVKYPSAPGHIDRTKTIFHIWNDAEDFTIDRFFSILGGEPKMPAIVELMPVKTGDRLVVKTEDYTYTGTVLDYGTFAIHILGDNGAQFLIGTGCIKGVEEVVRK